MLCEPTLRRRIQPFQQAFNEDDFEGAARQVLFGDVGTRGDEAPIKVVIGQRAQDFVDARCADAAVQEGGQQPFARLFGELCCAFYFDAINREAGFIRLPRALRAALKGGLSL